MESAIKENVGNSYFKLLNQKTLEDNSEICTNNKWKNNNIREQILLDQRVFMGNWTLEAAEVYEAGEVSNA